MKKLMIGGILLLSLCSGCANITLRPVTPKRQLGPYDCTAAMNEIIADPYGAITWPYTKAGYVMATMEWCGAIIDWPFDAICDTLLWPWDKYWYRRGYPKQ